MNFKLDHVGIVVTNLEKAIDFYVNTFGCKRWKILDDAGLFPNHKFRYTLLPIGDNYIELLEPHAGPFYKILKTKGEGAMAELCFEVDDMDAFVAEMTQQGIALMDMGWDESRPLQEKKYFVSPSGNKNTYLPMAKTFGTWIEVLQRAWR
jgi:catechol 2,3-dioxygenase-like lactoylglutathione lyase family enzyme